MQMAKTQKGHHMKAKVALVKLVVIAIAGAAVLGQAVRAQAQCTSDSGAFFCENFENGMSKWAPHGDITVVSPGLNGTNNKARFYNVGIIVNGGAGMDASINKAITNGTIYYMDFWLEYESGFQWQFSPLAQNSSFKTIDIIGPSNVSGCSNRLLLTVWGWSSDSPAYSIGHPQLSIYPNYCTGGTDPGAGTNRDTEKFPNVVTNFAFVGGHAPYHVTIEVTSATGLNGRVRMWVDGVLISDRSGIQTSTDPIFTPQAIGLGGPQANASGGQYNSYDEIRFTTTNIAPSTTTTSLGTPAGLTVR